MSHNEGDEFAALSEFRVLGRDAIRRALPLSACVDLMVQAMVSVSERRIVMPLRQIMSLPDGINHLGLMPGYVAKPEVWGTKLICLIPDNPKRGLSTHNGVVLLHDMKTGFLCAILDAAEITALRTPAATAAASRVLARPDSRELAMLGTGEQAVGHLKALSLVHPLQRIRIWGRNQDRALALAKQATSFCAAMIETCDTVEQAVYKADVICTATTARDPILKGEWISPGTHVNLVGSSIRATSEIDHDAVAMGTYFVDYRPSAEAQAGELNRAVEAGRVSLQHIAGEIGDVHLGRIAGRTSRNEITLYKSLGVSAQDLIASQAVYEAACEHDLGRKAHF